MSIPICFISDRPVSIEIADRFLINPHPHNSYRGILKKCLKMNDLLIVLDSRCQISSFTFSKYDGRIYSKIFWIQLDDEPLDIAPINRNDIAVLFRSNIKCIGIGCYYSGITKEITLDIQDRTQYALAFASNLFYVAQQNHNTLVVTLFNSDGHSIKTVDVCPLMSNNIDVQLTIRTNIYCSIFDPAREEMKRSTVYCFDDKNWDKWWTFQDKCLGLLYGCTTDQYRNVYVTNGNHLTVISSNGRNYKILLDDVLPFSDVFFDEPENCLVVSSPNGTIRLLLLSFELECKSSFFCFSCFFMHNQVRKNLYADDKRVWLIKL